MKAGKGKRNRRSLTLPTTHPCLSVDEEESEDDDRDVVTRAAFKIRSQKLIEARSKKRNKSRRS